MHNAIISIVVTAAVSLGVMPGYAHEPIPTERVSANGTVRLQPATKFVHRRDRELRTVEVRGKRLIAKFNNGSRWSLVPCKYEDSERCFWNAGTRGNGHGTSFVRLWGKTFRIYVL